MHSGPVPLLSIYLYGLCGVAYTGKPLCIFALQQVLSMLLLHILLQGGVCACQGPCFVILVSQNVDSAWHHNWLAALSRGIGCFMGRLVLRSVRQLWRRQEGGGGRGGAGGVQGRGKRGQAGVLWHKASGGRVRHGAMLQGGGREGQGAGGEGGGGRQWNGLKPFMKNC